MDEETNKRICRLIAGLIVSDEATSPTEAVFLDRMLRWFELPLLRRDELFPVPNAKQAEVELAQLSPEAQRELVGLLVQAAAADNQYQEQERHYLATVARTLGIPEEDLHARVHKSISMFPPPNQA